MAIQINDFRNIANNPGKYIDKRIVVLVGKDGNEVVAPLGLFKRIVKFLKEKKSTRITENMNVYASFKNVLQMTYSRQRADMLWDELCSKIDQSKKLTGMKVKQVMDRADALAKIDEKVIEAHFNISTSRPDFNALAKYVKEDLGAEDLVAKYGLTDCEAVGIHLCASNFAQITQNPDAIYDNNAKSVLCQEKINLELRKPGKSQLARAVTRQAISGLNKLPEHTGQIHHKMNSDEISNFDPGRIMGKTVPLKRICVIADDDVYGDDDHVQIYRTHGEVCKEVSKFVGGDRDLFFFNPEAYTRCTFVGKQDGAEQIAEIDVFFELEKNLPDDYS